MDAPGRAAPFFEWQFTGLTAGEQFGVSVNIPIGPTDVDTTAATDYRFKPDTLFMKSRVLTTRLIRVLRFLSSS